MRKIVKKFLSTVLVLSLLSGFSVNIASFAAEIPFSVGIYDVSYNSYDLYDFGGKIRLLIERTGENTCKITGILPSLSLTEEERNCITVITIPSCIRTVISNEETDLKVTCIDFNEINRNIWQFPALENILIPSTIQEVIGESDVPFEQVPVECDISDETSEVTSDNSSWWPCTIM